MNGQPSSSRTCSLLAGKPYPRWSNIFKVSLWDGGSNLPLLNTTVEYMVADAISTPKTILNTYNTYRDIERAVYDANRSVHRTVRRTLQ